MHLGAMGETVRDLLRAVGDPSRPALAHERPGGRRLAARPHRHLPVRVDGVRLFVACRAHHVDVGGTTPGSMPPRSRWPTRASSSATCPCWRGGQLRRSRRRPHRLPRSSACSPTSRRRSPPTWPPRAGSPRSAPVPCWPPGPPAGRRRRRPRRRPRRPAGRRRRRGHHRRRPAPPGPASRRRRPGRVDLGGTGGFTRQPQRAARRRPRRGALRAARVVAAHPIPLNDGALRRVRIVRPPGSLVDPPPGAAVAGGNVETSQRLVDLVLRAAGYAAASAGTMSNLTLGGDAFAAYETVGGGQGASPRGPGPSGRQLHMTNTRATDPEVLEHRLPVRLVRFALRPDTGGSGIHRGGDGLVREVELLAPATAALLATRRDAGAPGLDGGGEGAPGDDAIRCGGTWQVWEGDPVALQPGDRVRVGTPGGGGWGRLP
ncbi:MAG: hydantoinase B/oxoprolinase family protein [Myxococcota bacterium]